MARRSKLAGPLSHMHPLVEAWFTERFGKPTSVQREVWPAIARGEHVLATAPTGSGKTLAAFLYALDQLGRGNWAGGGVRVLYISPLRALNNDVRRNLLDPLAQLQARFADARQAWQTIRVATRSGDTDAAERRRTLSKPPEVLITTPESLSLLLSSMGGRRILTGVKSVILDEIHAVAGQKRGLYLMTAIERLTLLSGEFQRIVLSATAEPLDTIARFVGGYTFRGPREGYVPRPVTIVRSSDTKQIDFQVSGIPKPREDEPTFWPQVAREMLKEIAPDESTLVFVNNRRLSERLCHLLNEASGNPSLSYSHHGAMAREVRALVEQRLKEGKLNALVATSSLELGIDIGSVRTVLLVETPRTLNGAIQRVGRAGHSVGATSRARLYPSHSADLLEAAVFAPLVQQQKPAPIRPVHNALDVLAQVIVAMCGSEPWKQSDLFDFIRTIESYQTLSRKAFDLTVQMLQGRYFDARLQSLRPRLTTDAEGKLIALDGAMSLVYTSGGVIPDRGYFNVKVRGAKGAIGQLDEEFVWERRVGDQFRIGMQSWKIDRITHNDVEVSPGSSLQAGMPFWRGETEDRDFAQSEKVAVFLEAAENDLKADREDALRERWISEHCLSEQAADDLLGYLRRQRGMSGASLPHRHHLLIERQSDPAAPGGGSSFVVIHARWGGTVLRPWAIALGAAWEQRYGASVQIFNSDDCILIQQAADVPTDELLSLVEPEQVESLIRQKLELTGFFGARFRENAGRALLLPRSVRRRMPLWLNRLRARRLFGQVSRFADFPIVAETWRQCLVDDLECERLSELLVELREGRIAVTDVRTTDASPFAAGLVWQSTNQHVYEKDQPADASGTSSLTDQTLRGVVFDASLRPRVPQAIVDRLVARLQRTAPGYAPSSADELVDVVNERLIVPAVQWESLCQAIEEDQARELANSVTKEEVSREAQTSAPAINDAAELVDGASGRLVWLQLPHAGDRLLVAVERLPRLLRATGARAEDCTISTPDGARLRPVALAEMLQDAGKRFVGAAQDEDDLLPDALATVLAYQGPVSLATLHAWLGVELPQLQAALAQLIERGQAVFDLLREEAAEPEYCDAENLERLLRMLRASHRSSGWEARPSSTLPMLFASLQGVLPRGYDQQDLQDRLAPLLGLPLPAELWESAVLPARMHNYQPTMFDGLLQSSRLVWFGVGAPKLIAMSLIDDLDLYRRPVEAHSQIVPADGARYDFSFLSRLTGRGSADLGSALWTEAWSGAISADSFAPIRKGVETDFEIPAVGSTASAPFGIAPPRPLALRMGDTVPRAGSSKRAARSRDWAKPVDIAGAWVVLPTAPADSAPDRLQQIEANRERVRQLLDRFGILFRQLLSRELPALRWSALLPALRLMELSGEVVAGQFYTGVAGLQFASPAALRHLTSLATREGDAVYWISAADPASICGLGLEDENQPPLPARQASTWLVYHGERLVLVSRRHGRELEFRIDSDDPNVARYLVMFREQLAQAVSPPRRIEVEKINGIDAPLSAFAGPMRAFGFSADYRVLTLYRKY